jgi:hypothetical protein
MRRFSLPFDALIVASLLFSLVMKLHSDWSFLGTLVYCCFVVGGLAVVTTATMMVWIYSYRKPDPEETFNRLAERYTWLSTNETLFYWTMLRPILFVVVVLAVAVCTSSIYLPLVRNTTAVTLVNTQDAWSILPVGSTVFVKPWDSEIVAAWPWKTMTHTFEGNRTGEFWRVKLHYTATELADTRKVSKALEEGRLDPRDPEPFLEREYLEIAYTKSAIPWGEMGTTYGAQRALIAHFARADTDVTHISVSYH